jgi:hypothetical protein
MLPGVLANPTLNELPIGSRLELWRATIYVSTTKTTPPHQLQGVG